MVKQELVKRSPLRLLEKSIHGGVGKGNIGVIYSKKGIGKTACLVHIATDKLIQGKHVIHVSFSSRTDHIISWYEDIFAEISKTKELDEAMAVHDELIRNRVIMNFNQDGVSIEHLRDSLKAMIQGGQFSTDAIIVDGLEIEKLSDNALAQMKAFAEELGIEIWISVSVNELPNSEKDLPSELVSVKDDLGVIISLKNQDKQMKLSLVKDHDNKIEDDLHLILDTKSLLIVQE